MSVTGSRQGSTARLIASLRRELKLYADGLSWALKRKIAQYDPIQQSRSAARSVVNTMLRGVGPRLDKLEAALGELTAAAMDMAWRNGSRDSQLQQLRRSLSTLENSLSAVNSRLSVLESKPLSLMPPGFSEYPRNWQNPQLPQPERYSE